MNQDDKKWELYNKELIAHVQKSNWGLYRCTRFDMAEFLRKSNRLLDALETYLEVCYLDLNGAENRESIIDDPELLKEYPPFDISMAFLAPGIIDRIRKIIEKLNLNKEKLKKIFVEHNNKIRNALKTPLSPIKCWESIEKEFEFTDIKLENNTFTKEGGNELEKINSQLAGTLFTTWFPKDWTRRIVMILTFLIGFYGILELSQYFWLLILFSLSFSPRIVGEILFFIGKNKK